MDFTEQGRSLRWKGSEFLKHGMSDSTLFQTLEFSDEGVLDMQLRIRYIPVQQSISRLSQNTIDFLFHQLRSDFTSGRLKLVSNGAALYLFRFRASSTFLFQNKEQS